MNKTTEQVILGSMCGDGHISFKYKYPVYREIHSIKQEEYIMWKYKLLKDLKPKTYHTISGSQQNKKYKSVGLYTPMNEKLLNYHRMFYGDLVGEKSIPFKVLQMLKPLGLAIWYMDDGSYNFSHSTVEITSCMNNIKVQHDIKRYFESKYEMKCYIHNVRKGLNLIRFSVESSDKFLKMIRRYVPDCMSYKLGHLYSGNDERFKAIISKAKNTASVWRMNNYAKICKYQNEYRLNNKERINAWHREYYKNNREKIINRRKELKLRQLTI